MSRPLSASVAPVSAVAAVGLALAGCGSASARPSAAAGTRTSGARAVAAPPGAAAAPPCAAAVSRTLGHVAVRIYDQAAGGRNVASSVRRLSRSTALATAVARGRQRATRAALRPLLKSQIHRIVVTRGTRVLATVGRAPSLAPVHGSIRAPSGRVVGHYTMAVSNDAAIAGITHAVTGARVVVRAGGRTVAGGGAAIAAARLPDSGSVTIGGRPYTVFSYRGTAFPRGTLRVWVLSPQGKAATCAPSAKATAADTIGAVGERLFGTESRSGSSRRALAHAAADSRFVRAVAARDPAAMRAEVIRFFHVRRLHVVRVRAVTAAGRLVNDVGGPYVLAPASRTLRLHGRVVGRVTLSVQDDTGYIKLMHRFTGAEVLLRTASGQVPGSSLSPGPATIPDRGPVTYRGRTYRAYSFTARAFPAGPLRISLLTPGG